MATQKRMANGTTAQQVVGTGTAADGSPATPVVLADKTILTAGERQVSNEALSYLSVKEDWNYSIVAFGDDPATVCNAPCILGRIFANIATTTDGFVVKDDTTSVYDIGVGVPAVGTANNDMVGTRFETSLIIDFDATTDAGSLVVQWRYI